MASLRRELHRIREQVEHDLIGLRPITDHRQIPTWVIFLFDRLERQYKVNDYKGSRQKAWQFIVANPLETYRWNGDKINVNIKRTGADVTPPTNPEKKK